MKLKNASRYFDTCPVYDGYTGAMLFKVQASTFMESALEGSVSTRRTVSLDPSIALPAHSVIMLLGESYVTGEVNSDEWSGEAIRKTCWTRKVSDYFNAKTPQQLLNNVATSSFYGQKKQRKEVTTLESSNTENTWDGFFSINAPLTKGQFLKSGTTLYRVSFTYKDVDGFLTCGLDQLQYGVSQATVAVGKTYDPVTDTYTGTSSNYPCLPIDYKLVFDTQTQADFSVDKGDICLILPLEVNPSTGLTLTLVEPKLSGEWRVLNAFKELDAWNVHVRRV